nr:MBL fold metallo-hydrolase [uncultured Desulfobacter sp.]
MGTRLLILSGYILAIAVCLGLTACAVFNQDRFGKLPKGDRLGQIQKSPHYRDGKFRNLVPTPKFSTNDGMMSVIWSGIFDKADRLTPDSPVPTEKTDLKELSARFFHEDTVIWMGHSSWYVQAGGKRILIDPVFSKSAAPFSFLNKSFAGTNIYTAEDMPQIDCLLISHDHWDHLDYPTIMALRSKVKQVICPLGVGAYFENWGYPTENIREGDWHDRIFLGEDVVVHVLPARHYSGRLFKENKTFWAGFALETPEHKIFFSGDSGYGSHFSQIGKAFNGFDLVMLDCGQYDPRWAYIHMTPKEAVQAARDLGAKAFIPAHVGRFTIANHSWDEPFKQLAEDRDDYPFRLLTPKIGEPVILDAGSSQQFSCWWETTGKCPETEQSGETL